MVGVMLRLQCGARFLDTVNPSWYEHISLEVLDISHGRFCVLGQLYGSYIHAIEAFDLFMSDCEIYGFLPYENGEDGEIEARRLTELWKGYIQMRRNNDGKC